MNSLYTINHVFGNFARVECWFTAYRIYSNLRPLSNKLPSRISAPPKTLKYRRPPPPLNKRPLKKGARIAVKSRFILTAVV